MPADLTEPVMPGGGISRRPLHLVILADCSGSMKGEKIQALNFAIANMLPHLVAWERDQALAEVLLRVLAFADTPTWHIEHPTPVGAVRWAPLSHVEKGRTNMGPALRMVAASIGPDRIERRALRPALILITDGLPTDPPGGFEAGLQTLLSVPAGAVALRLAIAIGRDARSEAINRFIGDPTVPVLVAQDADEIADRLVAASVAASRMSEVGADRLGIAQRLLVDMGGSDSSDPDQIV